jgi:hypothetical protein
LNTELHHFYDNITPGLSTTCAIVMAPPVIAQGDTNAQRVGDSLRVTRNSYNVRLANNSTTACTIYFRVIFTYRHQGYYGTPIDVNDVLQSTTSIQSFHSPNLTGNDIRILSDRTYAVESAVTGKSTKYFPVEFVLSEQHMEWQITDTTGLGSNLNSGAIECLAYYTSAGTVTGVPTMSLLRETQFVDN